jgi:hypothetical protein
MALDEQLDLNVPSSRTLKIKSSAGIEPSISIEGDRRLYHWATSNLKIPPPVDIFLDFKFDVIKLLEGERPPQPPFQRPGNVAHRPQGVRCQSEDGKVRRDICIAVPQRYIKSHDFE